MSKRRHFLGIDKRQTWWSRLPTRLRKRESTMFVQDTLYESCDGDFVSRGGEFASQAAAVLFHTSRFAHEGP